MTQLQQAGPPWNFVSKLLGDAPISRLVGASTVAAPIVGYNVRSLLGLWPPVGGSVKVYAVAGITLFVILIGRLAHGVIKNRTIAIRISLLCAVILAASLCWYVHFVSNYVVSVHPGGDTIYVAIGSERTVEALRDWPQLTDQDLVQKAGLYDGSIERMWTKSSVQSVRLNLLFSYALVLSAANVLATALSRVKGGQRRRT
jgi:hypothetical protein